MPAIIPQDYPMTGAAMRKITEQEHLSVISSIQNIEFVCWPDGFSNVSSRVTVKCLIDGHQWTTSVNHITRKTNRRGCKKCQDRKLSEMKTISKEDRISQIEKSGAIRFISWHGDFAGSKTRVNVECKECGYNWSTTLKVITNNGSGCPKCNDVYKYTEEERVSQINDIGKAVFLSWDGEYKNAYSRANVSCVKCGESWSARVHDLVSAKSGCPSCTFKSKITEQDRINSINSIHGLRFIKFDGEYRNYYSKALIKCEKCQSEFTARIGNIIHNGTGCPACSSGGFNQCAPGYVYSLISDCGSMIKIGISGNTKKRIKELERCTPFKFSAIGVSKEMDGYKALRMEKSFHSAFCGAGLTGFDGATEWLKFDHEIISRFMSIC